MSGSNRLKRLADIKPTPNKVDAPPIDASSSLVSRDTQAETVQIGLRGKVDTINRFKALCKTERYPYGEMLEILIDFYERNQ